jgi:hypothetical protein
MDILERRETWLHTYFVTDCARLSVAQGRAIEAAILPVLRQHHIVYGIRFAESRHDPGIRIVLECIPLRRVLDSIEEALRRIVAPIPAKPATVRLGGVESDAVTSPTESSSILPSANATSFSRD